LSLFFLRSAPTPPFRKDRNYYGYSRTDGNILPVEDLSSSDTLPLFHRHSPFYRIFLTHRFHMNGKFQVVFPPLDSVRSFPPLTFSLTVFWVKRTTLLPFGPFPSAPFTRRTCFPPLPPLFEMVLLHGILDPPFLIFARRQSLFLPAICHSSNAREFAKRTH